MVQLLLPVASFLRVANISYGQKDEMLIPRRHDGDGGDGTMGMEMEMGDGISIVPMIVPSKTFRKSTNVIRRVFWWNPNPTPSII